MLRFGRWLVLLLLAALLGAGPAQAQYAPAPNPGLDEMKYRAIYGRPPPPPEEDKGKKAKEGEGEAGEEAKPRYRFGDDALLSPPGQRTPAAPASTSPAPAGSAAPAYPPDLDRPPGAGDGDRPPRTQAPASPGLPQREIRVQVLDDLGRPVPLVSVSLSTRQYPFFSEGLTNQEGFFQSSVPCYLPGRQSMLSHTLRVSGDWGSVERLVVTRQDSCGRPDVETVMLSDPNRVQKMLQPYRERQERYDTEEEEEEMKAGGAPGGEEAPGQTRGQGQGKGQTGGPSAP